MKDRTRAWSNIARVRIHMHVVASPHPPGRGRGSAIDCRCTIIVWWHRVSLPPYCMVPYEYPRTRGIHIDDAQLPIRAHP